MADDDSCKLCLYYRNYTIIEALGVPLTVNFQLARPTDQLELTGVALSHKMFGGPLFSVFALSYSRSPVSLPLMDSNDAYCGVRGRILKQIIHVHPMQRLRIAYMVIYLYAPYKLASWCLDTAATFSITFINVFYTIID